MSGSSSVGRGRFWWTRRAALRWPPVWLQVCMWPALLASASGAAAETPPVCRPHAGMQAVARDMMATGKPLSAQLLTEQLRRRGIFLPGVRALLLPNPGALAETRFLASFGPQAQASMRCGRAIGPSGRLLLAAPALATLKRDGPDGLRVVGALHGGYGQPELVVQLADYEFFRLGVSPAQLATGVVLPARAKVRARVQLMAVGPSGPVPVSMLAWGPWSDLEGSEKPAIADTAGLGRAIDDLRFRAGRPGLRRHRLLTRAAQAHSEYVCAQRRSTHQGSDGRDPEQRIRAAGLIARRVGEAVARAKSPSDALTAMVHSPSHLLSLLEAGFTDAGFGITQDGAGGTCVVVLLASWPRFVGH